MCQFYTSFLFQMYPFVLFCSPLQTRIILLLLIPVILDASNIELNVFKCRYMLGLSNRETAERLGYTIDRIKQINREISKKM